jgi:hypothetical protein
MFEFFGKYNISELKKLKFYYETRHKFHEDIPSAINLPVTSIAMPSFTLFLTAFITISAAIIGQTRSITDSSEKSSEFINYTLKTIGQTLGNLAVYVISAFLLLLGVTLLFKWYSNRLFCRYRVICEIIQNREKIENRVNSSPKKHTKVQDIYQDNLR